MYLRNQQDQHHNDKIRRWVKLDIKHKIGTLHLRNEPKSRREDEMNRAPDNYLGTDIFF